MLFSIGFIFMFTLGGLYIHLALSLKTTICLELLTIILLEFYLNSVKIYNFEQLAGNQKIINILVGTSENKHSQHTIVCEDIVRETNNLLTSTSLPLCNKNFNIKNFKYIKIYNSLRENRIDLLK